ncbi:MAG: NAD(P)(+) transhydrogenase (Re/Si-specific) subunit beta [Gemmatimonadota bacterium]
MPDNLVTMAYIFAAGLFILSLSGLSRPETARWGVFLGIFGMILALGATAGAHDFTGYGLLAAAFLPAALIGLVVATKVKMTELPQLVAVLHSFVGAAAVLVGFATLLEYGALREGAAAVILSGEIFLGVCIGSITFTGSVVAAGKLHGLISGRPLLLPARHFLNLVMLLATVGLGIYFVQLTGDPSAQLLPLYIATGITALIGLHLVAAIGGADMPVVVSMLNSYSGWAAAAAGFMLSNDLLIVTGALVGSSGAILSYIMCRGMNRSFISVILGGFGTAEGTIAEGPGGDHVETSIQETLSLLRDAKRVVIVPGYGMAIAQAQHSLAKATQTLRDRGVDVRFAIHPVAGRLPGHMNVLLAEAGLPYDIVHEMEEINDDFPETDVVLVVGANDIVNPSALEDPNSSIAGMPVLEVWHAKVVIVMKRTMASGYAGIENPLFFRPNTRMLFGDAGKNSDALVAGLLSDSPTSADAWT